MKMGRIWGVFLILGVVVQITACGSGGGGGGSNNPIPSITTISPTSVAAGAAAQTLTINGTNFSSSSTVTFNGNAHTATLVNATQLTISLSTGDQATVGSYPVVVTNPAPGGGASNSANFAVNNPVPSITGFSPASVIVGAAGQTLIINGTNFVSSSTVTFNGAAHTPTFVNATRLTITLSASDQATLGSYPVVVTNPAPGGGASNSANLTVANPVPSITSISPTSAPAGAAAQTLTINGTNFLSISTVTFNGTAHTPTLVNATRLTIALSVSDQATLGSYPVIVTNPSGGASPRFNFNVTTSKALTSSIPSNTLGVLIQGTSVSAYVPNGSWATSTTGVQLVPIEPLSGGLPQSISTRDTANSCASNSVTGETVCTANGTANGTDHSTDIYLITGSTLTATLTSGSNVVRPPGPTGCENCGVAIDAVSNTAIISMGLSSAASGTGIQLLNLANNTFATPTPAVNSVSEGIQTDPCRNIILSPSEQGVFDVFNTSSTSVTEFANPISGSPTFDSAAEDCATGIAMATIEGTASMYITDLTQATFTPGFPIGTWTAPGQAASFPEFASFVNGTNAIAVVPGSHLALVSGEGGGDQFGVLLLPSTSGSGIPAVVDYAAAVLPTAPDGHGFEQGTEPHTLTGYASPTSSKAYGLMANGFFIPPTYLAVIDLQALLNAPRTTGTHTVDPTYDLLANGVVRYVSTH